MKEEKGNTENHKRNIAQTEKNEDEKDAPIVKKIKQNKHDGSIKKEKKKVKKTLTKDKNKKKKETKQQKEKKENKEKIIYPVNLVSVMYTIKKTRNEMMIVSDTYPTIQLYLPFLEDNTCEMCTNINETLRNWYQKDYNDGESIDTYLSCITKEHLHQHDIKNHKDDTIKPKKVQSKEEKEINEQNKQQTDNNESVELEDDRYDDIEEEDDIIEKIDHHQHILILNEEFPIKILTRTWSTMKKQLYNIFYVERSNGEVVSRGKFKKFTPWPYQENFANYVVNTYDWQNAIQDSEHYLPFLMYLKMGLGKTLNILYALQKNPAPEVIIGCDLSTLQSRWAEELYTFMPQKKGCTVFHLLGYQQLTHKIREVGNEFVHGKVIILDESQEYRTLTPGMQDELHAFRESLIVFELTGTPLINQPEDLYGLNVLSEVSPVDTMKNMMEKAELLEQGQLNVDKFDYMTGVQKGNISQQDITDFYRWLYKQYQDRVCYYEPSNPILLEHHELYVPMSWIQTCEYIWSSKKTLKFGNISTVSGVRNSFDSMLRRVSNCLLDKDEKTVIDSNKMDRVIEFIANRLKQTTRKNTNKSNKKDDEKYDKSVEFASLFPIIIFSKFRTRGIDALYYKLKKSGLLSKLKYSSISGDTDNDDRARICTDYNEGKLDILTICRVGRRGLDLGNTRAMILLEVPDSKGEESQTIGRVARWGSKERQTAKPIQIYQMISTFPTQEPSKNDRDAIELYFEDKLKMNKRELHDVMKDPSSEIKRHMKELEMTVDEKCYDRNPKKQKVLDSLQLILRAASIPFEDIPARYNKELQVLLQ